MRHSPSISPADRLDRDMYLVLENSPRIRAHAQPAQEYVRGRSGRSSLGNENPRSKSVHVDRLSESSDRRKRVHPELWLV